MSMTKSMTSMGHAELMLSVESLVVDAAAPVSGPAGWRLVVGCTSTQELTSGKVPLEKTLSLNQHMVSATTNAGL